MCNTAGAAALMPQYYCSTASTANFTSMKFQASSLLLRLYSPVCVGPGRKPRRPVFSRRGLLVTVLCLGSILIFVTLFKFSITKENVTTDAQYLPILEAHTRDCLEWANHIARRNLFHGLQKYLFFFSFMCKHI